MSLASRCPLGQNGYALEAECYEKEVDDWFCSCSIINCRILRISEDGRGRQYNFPGG